MRRISMVFGLVLLTGLIQCKPSKEKKEQTTTPMSEETIPIGDNSRTAVDWNGTYYGFLPCADCEGILTEFTLNSDGSYLMKRVYWGKDREVFTSEGEFKWDESGGRIQLQDTSAHEEVIWFQVGENRLFQLDRSGAKIESDFAERYELRKQGHIYDIEGVYWKLVELRGQPVPEGSPSTPFIILVSGSNRVNGNGGCNTLMGAYELKEGSRISFSPLATTMMACQNADFEPEFLKVFDTADNYSLKGDTLSLNKARMAPLARFAVAFP